MTFISYHAALKATERFADKYDLHRIYQYRFELEEDGRCAVGIYSSIGTFLGYV